MKITRALLEKATTEGIIRPDQSEALWAFFMQQMQDTPSFRATHILYYLGGAIAIAAMSLFMTLGWESFGGWGLFFIALAYACGGLWLTEYFLKRRGLAIPAGICATFTLVLTPLGIYGLQAGLGFWPDGGAYRDYHSQIDWRWLLMELGTLAAAAVLLWRYRLPFLVMPVAVTLWYMSMDLAPFLFGLDGFDWELRKMVSLWFGLLMTLLAFWVDVRSRGEKDYAFWLYLFGVLTFWSGMSLMRSDSEWSKFAYLCLNLLMIAIGAVLSRRVFAVFGGLGAAGYVGYLAYDLFKDSAVFPFVLTAVGFVVIYLGIVWQRHEERISARLRAFLPQPIQQLLAHRG